MISTGILILVFTAVAGLAVYALLESANKRPEFCAFALFAWLSALVMFIDDPDFFVKSLGGINVAVPDVLCAFLAGISGLRLIRQLPVVARPLLKPVAVIFVMLGLSYLRGLASFGLQHATNEFREFFYFLSTLAFALSYPSAKLAQKIPLVTILGGALLVLVAAIRIPMMGGFGLSERAVPSYAALAMGQTFFLGWFWLKMSPRARVWRWLIFGFLPFSFLMLHRSVWMALAAGIAVVLILDRAGRNRLFTTLLIGGVAGSLAVGFIFGDRVMTGLDQAVEETSSEDSTLSWRVEGWVALLRPESGWNFVDLAIGRPMGSGYARKLGDSIVNSVEIEEGVIPHNYYISMLLRGGVIGLIALITLYITLIKILLRQHQRSPNDPFAPCFITILATQLVYYVPYSADMIQGLFLGSAVAFATAVFAQSYARSNLHEPRGLNYVS